MKDKKKGERFLNIFPFQDQFSLEKPIKSTPIGLDFMVTAQKTAKTVVGLLSQPKNKQNCSWVVVTDQKQPIL